MNCKSIRLVVTLGLAVLGLSALLLALSGQQRAYAAWPGQGQALPLSRIVEDVRQASRAAAERSEAEQAVLASAPVAETSAALADSLSRAPLALASNGAAVVTVCGSGCDYASVQAAVSAVPAGGTVKVAAGVYTDTDGDGRVVRITKTLSLLGGYTPADWDTPDPQANLTALDAEGAGQVVYINDNVAATVAGFHIRNGRVAGANGSGLYVGSGNSLIRDNRIYNNTLTNTARYSGGGGVYIAGGDPIIQNNAIYSNSAIVTDTSSFDGGGGGVYVYQGGAQIEGNTIWGNYVYAAQGRGGGGGIYIYGDDASTVVVRDNVIATNTASVLVYPGGGGGVYVQADDSLIEYNQIYSNSLGIISENGGGGIFVGSGTSPYISYQAHIRGNTISRNSVKLPSDLSPVGYLKGGGGIYVFNVSAIVEGNRIVDNRAPRLRGGGILILQDAGNGQAVIQNNVIQANSSTTGGGIGLRQYVGSGLSLNPTIVNNTLYDNRASSAGGGIYREFPAAYPYCSPSVYNNILVSNTQYAIASSGTPTLTVYYSDFSNNPGGDCSTATRCETVDGNLFADPSFASSGTDFHLQAGSGCIDKASPDVYADVDMDGYLRPFGPRADMGAYESYTHAGDTCFAYIDTIIPTQIFTSVQAAIEAADPPADWLIKLSGTCSQVQTISGLTQVAYLTESLTLRGGYALGDWSVSDPVVNPTFLDAQDQGRVVYIDASGAVTIENACLTNGQASLGGGSNWGGGVYVAAGSPVLSAVTLVSSSASLGGGLYNTSAGTVSLRDSTVANNTASTSGGGVYNAAGASLVIGAPAHVNRFYGNTAVNGGALYNAGVASVQANLIYDNEATDGGGVYNASTGQATLWNTMLYANTATDQGGALYAAGTFTTANNTLYGNQAATGGGIYQAGGTLDVLNTIIVSNTASSAGGGGYSAAGSLNVGYNAHLANSPSYGLPAASTDITDENPVFVSEAAQDFHLTPDSPDAYMDEGLDLAWIDFDIDGDSRPLDGGYAIGADEARIPGLQLAPSQSGAGLPGELLVYAHLLTNTSGFTDTISFLYANSLPLWDVQVPGPVELGPAGGANEARTVYVSVTVPFDYLSGVTNTTYVTASLGQYPDRQASVANVTTITRSVGVTVAPSLSIDLSPGRTYSFTHWVTNTGNWTDTYTLTLSGAWASLFVSSTIGSPAVITLGPAVPGYLNWQVVSIPITVPLTAAAFLSKSAVLAATSASNPAVRAVLTDTTTVKPTFGDRFVKMTGDDTENNCAVQFSPCRTVHHAVEQASESDTVKIAEGTYSETELRVNKNITLTGGYSSTTWIARDPLAYPTTLSGGGRDRVIYIPGSGLQPIIDGLVVRDGHTNGQGGGLYVEVSASPVLRNVTFESNHADGHGGAIYIAGGELVITNSVVASNTTQSRGGGIYNAAGELTLFNMMIYSNTAAAGGGVYVGLASAEAVLKNNTFFGNAATTGSGGAVYNAAAALTFINNLVISNTAAAIGGGLYTAGPTDADFNDFWGNSEPASNVSVNAYSFDPLFRDVAAEDFHLQPTSPAIDTGDPTTTLDFDYDLDPRPSGQGFDIGADEFAGCYARLNHLGQDGPIFHNVQDVVDQATLDTDVVKVSGYCWGVHPIQVGNRVVSQTVHLTKTLTLQGGYIHPDWGQAYPITSPAILDAFGLGRVLYVYGQIKPVIAGFVMMGGDAAGLGNHGALGQDAGGLFYNSGADTTISATQFSSGQADVGGGLYNADGGVVYLMRPVTFTGNAAAADGGAVYNYDGWLSITGTTFVDNVAGGSGGGLFNSTLAGALVLRADAFVRNAAEEGSGGGAYVAGGLGTVVVQNNMVISNTAGTSGGGLYVAGGTFNPLNNTFYANSAGEQGGALYNASSGMRSINNTIFMGNEAGASGGAVYNASSVTITLDYNDVLTNTPDYTNSGGRFAFGVSYAVDPLFVDADGGDLHLQELSPLMDAGDPATLLTDDFDGDIRPSQHGFDVGADEIGGCFARIGDGTFTYGSVRLAVEDAAAGDLVKVAGRCIGVWPVADGGQVYTQTLYLTKPITLRGGYLVTNWRTSYVTVSTILDPLSRGRVLVASGPITPTIEKLTLTHGTADRGGGVYVAPGSQPVFSATWLVSNTATLGGGGLYNDGGAPTVFSATLYGNSVGSGASGAGLYNAVGTLAVSRTEIYNNFAPGSGTDCPDGGGGIYNAADAVLLANRVHHNDARCGGAVFNQGAGAFALLQNNMVYSNTAKGNGGGVCNVLGQATLEHNTVYGNEALANGGGVYNGGGSVLVTSTIFASNTATFGSGDGLFNNQGTAVLDYNDWWRNDSAYTGAAPVSGTHNVSMEPLFVNANGTDFHLTPASPLIDLGDPNSTVLVDFEGDARPTFNGFDIGADEVVGCYALNDRTGVLYGSVQRAVDGALAGDLIKLAGECWGVQRRAVGGQIYTQTVYIDKSLTLRGGYSPTNWIVSYPVTWPTTLDARSLGRVVYVAATQPVTVEALRLAGGDATRGDSIGLAAGGAVYNDVSSLVLRGNVISSSMAANGAGFYNAWGESKLQNDVFYSNTASGSGGAIYGANGSLLVLNNTLHGNLALDDGGGVYQAGGTMAITNTIFDLNIAWAGEGGAVYGQPGAASMDYSLFSGSVPTHSNLPLGEHSIEAIPWFMDLYHEDFHLDIGSPAIDAGDPATVLDVDWENDPRPQQQSFDIGADEVGGCYARVNHDGVDGPIMYNVQDAVDSASITDTVKVVGTCWGTRPISLDGDTYTQTVYLDKSLTVQGGYTLTDWIEVDIDSPARLDAQEKGRVVLVTGGAAVSLKNINLEYGDATFAGGPNVGGGLYVISSTAALDYAPLSYNHAQDGGALYVEAGAELTLKDSRSLTNTADRNGGGVYINASIVRVIDQDCTEDNPCSFVEGNTAGGSGGGVYLNGGSLLASAFGTWENSAGLDGGGIYNDGGLIEVHVSFQGANEVQSGSGGAVYQLGAGARTTLQNCLIYYNWAGNGGGGGVYNESGQMYILNCTVDRNFASDYGGAFFNISGTLHIANTIIVSNTVYSTTGSGGGIYCASGTCSEDYDDIWNNFPDNSNIPTGTHTISLMPLFSPGEDEAHEDHEYYLRYDSPCIDMGATLSIPPALNEADYLAVDRPTFAPWDIGAYEYVKEYAVEVSGDKRYADPGQALVYTNWIKNIGNLQDSFTVTVSGPWLVGGSFVTTTPVLTPDEGMSMQVTVSVPLIATTCDQSVVTVTATSRGDPDVSATGMDTTRVNLIPALSWIPDSLQGSGEPGEAITYSHVFSHASNICREAEFAFSPLNNLYSWSSLLTPQVVTLTRYSTSPVQMQVHLLDWVAGGLEDQASLKATLLLRQDDFVDREDWERATKATSGDTFVIAVDRTLISSTTGARYVAVNGNDENNNCTDPEHGACATIQYAVGQAAPGDAVLVSQGIYTGSLLLAKGVRLQGGYTNADWGAPPNPVQRPVVLDAQGSGSVISISGPITVVVSGLGLTGGSATLGGGVYVDATSVTLAANVIDNNTAQAGGGVYVQAGDVRMVNTVVRDNTASDGGGGVYVYSGTATLVHDTLYANHAISGGAVYQAGGVLGVTNTLLVLNTASDTGGAVHVSSGTSALAYNDLWANTAPESNVSSTHGLSLDPLFAAAALGDFHLTLHSPVINAGTPVSVTDDWEGEGRPQLLDWDMGADEFNVLPGLQLEPAALTVRTMDMEVPFVHTLTNTGNYTDVVALTATIDIPVWEVEIKPPSAVTLAPDQAVTVWMTVSVPPTASIGTVGHAALTANSTVLSPSLFVTVLDSVVRQDEADVEIVKTAMPAAAAWLGPDDPITYTLVYTNYGPAEATDVRIVDELPALLSSYTYTHSGPSVAHVPGFAYEWALAAPIVSGAGGIITVSGRISPALDTVTYADNAAYITTTQNDVLPASNYSAVRSQLDGCPPEMPLNPLLGPADNTMTTTQEILFAWKSFGDACGSLGGSGVISYQLIISSLVGSSVYSVTGVPQSLEDPVTASLALPLNRVYAWTVRAFDAVGNPSLPVPSRVITVGLPALAVTKQAPYAQIAGRPFTYTLTVANAGLVDASGVVVTDVVPAGAWYISGGVQAGGVVTWSDLQASANGGTAQVSLVVSACQVVTNTLYRVASSEQGVGSPLGPALGINIVEPPTIVPAWTRSLPDIGINMPVYFTDQTTPTGGDLVTWQWEFGDGQQAYGRVVSHTYTTAGSYTVTLTVTDACNFVGHTSLPLTVYDVPDIAVTPLALVETLGPDGQAEHVLRVDNEGTVDLTWSIADTMGASWLTVAHVSGTVASGGRMNVSVRFDAAGLSAGIYTTTLRIDSNDPDEAVVEVAVMLTVLTGPMPNIAVSPGSLAETLSVSGQVVRELTIGNGGTGELAWSMAEVAEVEWLAAWPLSGTVAAGGSTGVVVTFTAPLTAGVYNAVLCLTSDDPDEAVVEVPVLLTVVDGPVPSIA
ncbi:MAG: PKD domain-containing protein, partial [Thermoflexales bacterium]|nr:PKD domain-containing protein [Thermoflexales bacterium]